jgi:L-ascorbate metabolism protein UlaG (beta-lactamase superfamily)
MDIIYYGHACFKLRGKEGTVVTDPYHEAVGFKLPGISADVVTVSHAHADHNALEQVSSTARRERPFYISELGEYEVGGISVFGVKTYHDAHQGIERGTNNVFTILLDGVRVCHLGDLGHELSADDVSAIGEVDVLLCPIGGVYSIDPTLAVKTIQMMEPRYVVPMHYRTDHHEPKVYGDLKTLPDFLQEYGFNPNPQDKLTVDKARLPEETELVVLTPQTNAKA